MYHTYMYAPHAPHAHARCHPQVMGAAWAPFVSLKKEQKLIKDAPFRYMRHPMYGGVVWMGVGSALLTGSWLVAAGWAGMMVALAVLRVPIEERVMHKGFGPQYAQYCKECTWRMVPYVW